MPWLKVIVLFVMSLSALAQFDLDEFETDLSNSNSSSDSTKESDADTSTSTTTSYEEASEDGEFEVVSVTGSHIKRGDAEGVSPVQVIDRKALEVSGYNSVSDVLRNISANSFGSFRESSGSSASGSATVSLRGLGADKTLVLLNGRRLPKDPLLGAVDLNMIPMAAVKQIDVLKDGASATYGSDALGGVINIITYKDYTGTTFNANKSITRQGGGGTQDMSLVTGAATAKSSVLLVMSHRKNEIMRSTDRSYYGGVSAFGSPGSYYDGDGNLLPDPNCPADQQEARFGGTVCSFDYTPYASEMPELEQYNIFTQYDYKTDYGFTLFGGLNYTNRISTWNFAPAPGQFSGTTPAGNTGTIFYRTLELGNRINDEETNGVGLSVGAKGFVTDTWDWEMTYDQNRVRRTGIGRRGYALISGLEEEISSGRFDPFADPGERGNLDSVRYEPWQDTIYDNQIYELKFTGELFEMSGGAVGAAIGFQHIFDEFTDAVDSPSERGEVFSNAGSSGFGNRVNNAAYIEFLLPVTKDIEMQLAGRYDYFSDFGSTTNPKAGIKYKMNDSVTFRSSYGTGFKAPPLMDLYGSTSFGFLTFIDHAGCAYAKANDPDNTAVCTPQQYQVQSGGNRELEEETAETFNIGTVIELGDYNFTIDYWRTIIKNLVTSGYLEDAIRAEAAGVDVGAYGVSIPRENGYLVIDDPIIAPTINLAQINTSGIDLNFQGKPFNNFSFEINYNYLIDYERETFPGVKARDFLASENGFPRYRRNITLTYFTDKFSFTVIGRTISAHKKAINSEGELPEYTEYDVNFNYNLLDNTSFIVGLQNALNSMPPLDETNPNNLLDDSLYNPRGQVIFTGIKQNF